MIQLERNGECFLDVFQCCEQLHALCPVPLTIVDADGKSLFILPTGYGNPVPDTAVSWVLADFRLQKRDALHPLITYVEPGYFVGVAALPDDRYCIVGLVSPFQHPRAEILAMTAQVIAPQKIQEFCNVMAQTPLVNLYRLKSLLCLLVKLAHGVSITPENILFVDNTVLRTERPDRALFSQREEAEVGCGISEYIHREKLRGA